MAAIWWLAATLAPGAGPAAAEPSVSDLLQRLAPKAAAPGASVEVLAWAEGTPPARTLVVTFATKGEAKLVADPGVSVRPLPRAGLTWADAEPAVRLVPGRDYFAAPPILRLPFRSAAGPVEAHVEYAYCLVARQCLFGEETVRVDLEPAAAGG
jgi:hypothetical protein